MCILNIFFCHVCGCEILEGKPIYRAHDKSFCTELHRDDLLLEFWPWDILFHLLLKND
jgi:hypothetical protein